MFAWHCVWVSATSPGSMQFKYFIFLWPVTMFFFSARDLGCFLGSFAFFDGPYFFFGFVLFGRDLLQSSAIFYGQGLLQQTKIAIFLPRVIAFWDFYFLCDFLQKLALAFWFDLGQISLIDSLWGFREVFWVVRIFGSVGNFTLGFVLVYLVFFEVCTWFYLCFSFTLFHISRFSYLGKHAKWRH